MLIEFVFTLENGTHDSDDAHDEFGFSDWPDILLYESRVTDIKLRMSNRKIY